MLNIPETFKNGFGSNSVYVYPIVIINKNQDNEIRLSRKKGLFDGQYYEDRFLKVGQITEKINVTDRTFQISQITITVSNFEIEGERFTQKFKDESFINSEVEIYYVNEACKTLEDCAFIYKGFVRNYKTNDREASFSIEDHSQYVLDIKTLPKGRTSDPADETIAASRDAVIPMTYGKVDKAPVIYSRAANLGYISRILPDDLLGTDSVQIYGYQSNEPLILLRGDDYMPVPKIFQDVPSGFVVSGFDYSAFNGTVQYEVDESTNEIIIEKKVSDALYSFGLPQNVQSRDQLQIRTDRRATGISLPEITSPIEFGTSDSVQYQQFEIDKSVDISNFYFPVPTDPILAGFYRNLKINGARYAYWNTGNPNVSGNNEWVIGYSNDMHMKHYCTSLSVVDTGEARAMDGCWLPQATDMAQHIKYHEGEDIYNTSEENPGSFISESRIRGWVWGIGGNEERGWQNTGDQTGGWQGVQIQECRMNGTNSGATGELPSSGRWLDNSEGVGFNDGSYNYCVEAIDDPSFQDWGDTQNIGHSMPITPLWGDGHFVDHGTIIDSTLSNVGYMRTSLGSMLLGLWVWHSSDSSTWDINNKDTYTIIPLDVDLKGDVPSHIWQEDTSPGLGGSNGYHNYFIDLNQAKWVGDTPKTLRKLMWGRKITVEESDGLYQDTGTFIPKGSSIFCKYPVLSQAVIRSTENNYNNLRYPNYYTDCKYCYSSLDENSNLYYLNDDGSYEINYQRINFLGQAPDNGGYQFVPYRNNYNGDNFYPIIYKQWTEHKAGDFYGHSPYDNWNTELFVSDLGRDIYYGGEWAVVENINNVRKEIKIDLTYNSIDGNDIAPGGVHQVVEGELELDIYREGIGSNDRFLVECEALHDNNNDIIDFRLRNITETTQIDPDTSEPNSIGIVRTGHQDFFDEALENENSPYNDQATVYAENGVIFATPTTIICDEPPTLEDSSDFSENTYNPTHILMEANNPDLVEDWRQNPNSINNLSLHFRLPETNGQTTAYIRGNIRDFKLKQLCIVSNASKQKYYANIWGRIDVDDGDGYGRYTGASMLSQDDNGELIPTLNDSQLLEKPSDILMHIIERELGYNNGNLASSFDLNSVEKSRVNHNGWTYAFSLNTETKAKDFIKDFCKETKFIPRFRYDGTFSFINIQKQYDQEDIIIDSKDVINFDYSKTEVKDIVLKCRVKYNYNVGNKNYDSVTNIDGDGAVPVNVDFLKDMYGIKSTDDAYLEVESKFIRDESTAVQLRDYLLEWNKNQHNVITCDIFPKYMEIECGDVVRFDSLIQDIGMFGDDYTEGFRLHGTYLDGGQWVYPYFMVTEVRKSLDKITLTLLQLHKFESFNINPSELTTGGDSAGSGTSVPAPEFGEETEEETQEMTESIVIQLGDANQDGLTNVLDVVQIVQNVVSDYEFSDLSYIAADVNQDGFVDVLDVVAIVQSIVNTNELGTITIED